MSKSYRQKVEKQNAAKRKKRSQSGSSPKELSFEENKRLIEAGETYRGYKPTGWKRI